MTGARPLRVAVLTCGAIVSRGHLPAFRAAGADLVDVVAFTSRSRSSAESAAEQWGGGAVVDDWRDVIARDDVDAVDICAPNSLHAEMAIAAARAGKHILVEKPMATTLADADAMIDAARQAGVVLMTAHNVRGAAPYLAAAQVVHDRRIGDVVGLRAAFGHAGPQAWAPGATWFYDREMSGGGALIDLGVHVADLVRAVTGDEVEEVTALARFRETGIDEAAQVAFRTRRGALGTFHASWLARPGPDHQLSVFGTGGTLTVTRGQARVVPADGGDPVIVEAPPSVNLYADFARACLGEAPAPRADVDGREALAIVLAAYESAATGCTVSVDHRREPRS
ncbi:MAG TPA: Gfo/Idh/MocA family oxidoreductase [Acidimicrobiales bacterium]|nr:Gfo/Idh/MocA family oxidoreductase [Acidimicrobiales bacterium]